MYTSLIYNLVLLFTNLLPSFALNSQSNNTVSTFLFVGVSVWPFLPFKSILTEMLLKAVKRFWHKCIHNIISQYTKNVIFVFLILAVGL